MASDKQRNSRDCGNAAELRKAVIETQVVIAKCLEILNNIPDSCGYGGLLDDVADELCYLREGPVKAALAAPPRNCDVGTVEEQVERFREFCDDEKGSREHCRNCRLCNAVDCELAWSQMPCEAEDGGAE